MPDAPPDTRSLGLCAPRYCDVPFPPYAYVPGRTPHPRRHPDGHMYGRPEPAAAPLDPAHWPRSTEYLFGCDLYNHGYWWEAHEAWEAIWKLAPKGSPERLLLQGLIQTGAAHLKYFLGHLDGARRLVDRAGSLLHEALDGMNTAAHADPVLMGLRFRGFHLSVQNYYAPRLRAVNEPPQHDSASFPYLVLQLKSA